MKERKTKPTAALNITCSYRKKGKKRVMGEGTVFLGEN